MKFFRLYFSDAFMKKSNPEKLSYEFVCSVNGGNNHSCHVWHGFRKLCDSQSVDLSGEQTFLQARGILWVLAFRFLNYFFSLLQNSSFESESHRQFTICAGCQYLAEFLTRTLAIFRDSFPGFLLLLRFNFGAAVVIADKDSSSSRQARYSRQLSLFCSLFVCFCRACIVT